jgi:hypothetical protein
MRFDNQDGRYMMHCHNLVHEDHDMMVQFEVGDGGDDPINADPCKTQDKMGDLVPEDHRETPRGPSTISVPAAPAPAAPAPKVQVLGSKVKKKVKKRKVKVKAKRKVTTKKKPTAKKTTPARKKTSTSGRR